MPQSSLASVPVTLVWVARATHCRRSDMRPSKEAEGPWDLMRYNSGFPWEPYKEVAKPLPIIFGEIMAVWWSSFWKRGNITLILKKGAKEDLGNHRSVLPKCPARSWRSSFWKPRSWGSSSWKLWVIGDSPNGLLWWDYNVGRCSKKNWYPLLGTVKSV